jgi:hypothetical protein
VNTIVYWLADHWIFACGLFTGLFGCIVLLACMERLAELTLGGPRARRIENLELTREVERWKRRYTALLDETEVVAGAAQGGGAEMKKLDSILGKTIKRVHFRRDEAGFVMVLELSFTDGTCTTFMVGSRLPIKAVNMGAEDNALAEEIKL